MKKLFLTLCALAAVFACAQAQPSNEEPSNAMGERFRAEHKNALAQELQLTDSEAKAFWPVYDEFQGKRHQAMSKMEESYKALDKGIHSGANVSKLLDNYVSSREDCNKLDKAAVKRYKKVLPPEKVAKLLMAEDRLRRQPAGERAGKPVGGKGAGLHDGKPDKMDKSAKPGFHNIKPGDLPAPKNPKNKK